MESPKQQSSAFSRELAANIEDFIAKLKRGELQGSKTVALKTANLMRHVVADSRWDHAETLKHLLKTVGRRLLKAQARELLIINIVCRVLHIVSEAAPQINSGKAAASTALAVDSGLRGAETPAMGLGSSSMSSRNLADQVSSSLLRAEANLYHTKSDIISEINEYITEVECAEDEIARNALDHIHSSEIILTCGRSRTVEKFLLTAARKRKFHVIVTECAPLYDGHEQAKALASPNIEVVVVPDSAVFAIMSRVNKVILGTHAVMANGGLIAASGTHMVAAAARHHSTQVMVCAGLYKHAPSFPFDDDRFNTLMAPDAVLPYGDASLVGAVDVVSPRYDYVPPDLVDILVDDNGGHLPSYIYRLQQDLYDNANDLAWNIPDQ
ncbi:GCD complex subunit gcd7 [Coemansia interrupta]|uniref:Translation initiation factor eIF2B subunit beta n=1 Tax=Coemansia interrupta TaxID=1126814 RepID=A0A9W8H7T2_9FUNG|nr:GCD complex subunit gcd7 [Coemansia interrupta]